MAADSVTSDSEAQTVRAITQALGMGDMARAFVVAEAAIARGLRHPLAYRACGLRLDELGKNEDALKNFMAAHELSPNDPYILNGVGVSLGRLGRLEDAMAAFTASLSLSPDLATSHFQQGWVLELHEQFAEAAAAYRRSIAIAPQHAVTWAGLANAAMVTQNWSEAMQAAQRALAIDPHQPQAIVALAAAEIQARAFAPAHARLRAALDRPGFLPSNVRTAALGYLGDALDGLDRTGEAFAAYATGNREQLAAYRASHPRYDLAGVTRDLAGYFENVSRWPLPDDAATGNEAVREHIFLVGFQRSGTTLLEQVLAAHPQVATLEESNTLNAPAEKFLFHAPGCDRLAALGGEDLAQERRAYWQRVQAHGLEVTGKYFVDKNPLNTIRLPLIARLFPGAKILFALRDPRDVVLSCFRRHFKVNASTCEFLDLERAAAFYNSVMTLGALCREKIPLSVHLHRHEDMLEDFEKEIRGVCAFLGLDWSEEFRDFAKIAQARDIASISASQVRSGLSNEGAGQWRRYAGSLAPVLPVLRPWVDKFGYSPD